MSAFISEFILKINQIETKDDAFKQLENSLQKIIKDFYLVCLTVDKETFEFLPIRSVDKALLSNVEYYIDQGVCAEAFTNGKTLFVFDTRKYTFKDNEALILFPLIFNGNNHGVILLVTKQDECKRILNELHTEVDCVFTVCSRFIDLFDRFERTEAERDALRKAEQNLNNLLESVPHGVVVFDNNNHLSLFNKNAEIMFGLSSYEIIGQLYREVFSERLTRAFDVLIQNTLIEGTIFDYEIEVELTPQLKLPIGMSTSVLKKQGEHVEGIVCICRDMTLTKEVNRLKEIDKMKSEFVSMVSHELKNPIAVVKSSVETLLAARRLGKSLGPDYENESLVTINGEIDRLAEIINDLLNLSRIEAGKVEINKKQTDIEDMLVAIINLFKVSTETHPISYECSVEDSIFIDQDKIKQVVINYINNAIKYSPNGSDIAVKAFIEDYQLVITVTDQGLGISEDQVAKVFDKFYRVSTKETAKIAGTGLGLSICRKIIELHHGKVWVKSKAGQGSTFGLNVPITTVRNDQEDDSV